MVYSGHNIMSFGPLLTPHSRIPVVHKGRRLVHFNKE